MMNRSRHAPVAVAILINAGSRLVKSTPRAKTFALVVLAPVALLWPQPVSAHEEVYTATLSGANESPPNASIGSGSVTLTMDLDLFTMHLLVNFSDLQGTVTAAHVHAGTATPFTGTALIATQLPTLPGFPLNGTSGNYEMTIDLIQQSSYNPDYFAANGGTVALVASAFYNSLREGRNYFEIETTAVGNGEVRGFLAIVPEPSTLALLTAGGCAGLITLRRNRRR